MSEMRKIERNDSFSKKPKKMQGNNRGSAVVEMTLLIPVFLGVVYFTILFFLFLIRSGSCMENLAEHLYAREETIDSENKYTLIKERKKGNTETVWMEEEGKLFKIQLELKGNNSDPVDVVRRWQIAVDTVSK